MSQSPTNKDLQELKDATEWMRSMGFEHRYGNWHLNDKNIYKVPHEAAVYFFQLFTKVLNERELNVAKEVKAKIEALDKLIMGAGEYHDDPYEYVVPLRDIRAYRAELSKFDLTNPVYKDRQAQLQPHKEDK